MRRALTVLEQNVSSFMELSLFFCSAISSLLVRFAFHCFGDGLIPIYSNFEPELILHKALFSKLNKQVLFFPQLVLTV